MKRVLPVLLALILIFSLFPAEASAENGALRAGDAVYFGVYGDAPIRWRVLDAGQTNAGTPGIFLLSEYALENSGVVYDNAAARWQGSKAQAWCADFLQSSFTAPERAAIPAVSKDEDPVQAYGLNYGEADLENEQVFFLSVPELMEYVAAEDGDAALTTTLPDGRGASWWLRTPHGFHNDYSGLVMEGCEVHDFLVYGSWGARPALNLSAEAAVAFVPARGAREAGDFSLPAGDEWKPVLLDESLAAPTLESLRLEGDALRVDYGAAPAGDCWLSLLVRDGEGRPCAFGRICAAETDGSAELDLNALELPEGGSAWLLLEQERGDCRANGASPLCPLSCTLRFDAGEGSGEMETLSLPLGSALELPDCVFDAPEGTVFDHWELEGQTAEEGVLLLQDATLRAVYAPAGAEAAQEPAGPAAASEDGPGAEREEPSRAEGFAELYLRLGPWLIAALAALSLITGLLSRPRAKKRREDRR